MAPLDPFFSKSITPNMQSLLNLIDRWSFSGRFYLAGGTALAMQIGHRRSEDLDFFTEKDELSPKSRAEIKRALEPQIDQIIEDTDGNLLFTLQGIRTGFFSYGYPVLKPFVKAGGVNLASIDDIGLMKLDAIISRGSRKDFYDLFFINQVCPIEVLLQAAPQKFQPVGDFAWLAMIHMIDFNNADRDLQPDLLVDLPWDKVKGFFREFVKRTGSDWLFT